MIECLVLTSVLWQGVTALPECSAVSLDVAGRGWMMLPQTGIPTDFALHRAGIGLGFAQGDLHGRVQIGHIQTGGTNNYIGIGGESNVYRIQLASVQYRPVDSVQLSAGIVEDLWVESGNHTWNYRNIEATATEHHGWSGNVGVTGVWSSSDWSSPLQCTLVKVLFAESGTPEKYGSVRPLEHIGRWIAVIRTLRSRWIVWIWQSAQSSRRSSTVIKSCRPLLECWGIHSKSLGRLGR